MKFIFIAVNYNGATHTKNYLDSLEAMSLPFADSISAVIVDNKSNDADLIALKAAVDSCKLAQIVELDNNLGYFQGLNAGIDACEKSNDALLIVGNNDLIFDKDFILNLKNINYDPDVLVIAPNIVTFDGRSQNPHVISKVGTVERLKTRIYFSNYYVGQTLRYASQKIKSVVRRVFAKPTTKAIAYGQMKIKRGIGACYVLTPNFFRFYERLDGRVFLWGEEALLSNQVEQVNGYTLYDPTIKILHCESASVKFIESRKRYEILQASYKIYRDYL